ncbi:MAG: Gfo/Idh/MocA family oxidoreductase [Candidatus Woesearchaeota archaeon]
MEIAFIGTGNIARQHMESIKGIPEVNISGLYDPNEEVLQARQAQFGGTRYSSIERMLDLIHPDAVYICVPPFAHGNAEFSCIERRIPFLVEKPQSNDLILARRIAEESSAAGIVTCSAYMNRYRKGVQEAKTLLQKYHISLAYGGWLFETPIGHPWITKKELSGGQLLEQTTHLFDLVRYLCGEVSGVHAYESRGIISQTKNHDIEDATVVSLQMKSGAVVNIQSSWSAGVDRFIYLNLFGPEVQVQFTNWEMDTKIKFKAGEEIVVLPGEQNIFLLENQAFLEAVRLKDQTKVRSDYADGVKSLEISFAARRSIETGKAITLNND